MHVAFFESHIKCAIDIVGSFHKRALKMLVRGHDSKTRAYAWSPCIYKG